MDWTGRPFIAESTPVKSATPYSTASVTSMNWATRKVTLGDGQTVTIWDLAEAGNVQIHKSTDEAAGWLWECWHRGRDLKEYDDIQDGVRELADGAVPNATAKGWLYFYELGAWEHDSTGYLADEDMTKAMQVVLYNIAEGVIQYRASLMEEWVDEQDDPDDLPEMGDN